VIVPAGAEHPDVSSLLALLVSKGVAKFKAPERVVIWDALPKNDAGKILKHRIRASLIRGDRERGEAGRGGSPRGD
jgi:non-ribosomal peptide synthetase component E (peptide arylation enzyme)